MRLRVVISKGLFFTDSASLYASVTEPAPDLAPRPRQVWLPSRVRSSPRAGDAPSPVPTLDVEHRQPHTCWPPQLGLCASRLSPNKISPLEKSHFRTFLLENTEVGKGEKKDLNQDSSSSKSRQAAAWEVESGAAGDQGSWVGWKDGRGLESQARQGVHARRDLLVLLFRSS